MAFEMSHTNKDVFMYRSFILSLFAFLSFASAADRSVSIAVPDGKLVLVNGSDVAVTYTVECFDRITGSNILTGASGVTLTAKKDASYESAGTCSGGVASTYKSPQNVVACPGSVSFSGAAALCGPASNLCTYNELVSRGVTSLQNFPHYYVFAPSADPFYMTYDSWMKGYPQVASGVGKIYSEGTYTNKGNSSNQRCSNTMGSVGTDGIGSCVAIDKNMTSSGALCCPTNNGFKSCKVTILSATPASGHLQSPQFKGGASF